MRLDMTTYYHACECPVMAANYTQYIRQCRILQGRGLLTYPDTPAIKAAQHIIGELSRYDE